MSCQDVCNQQRPPEAHDYRRLSPHERRALRNAYVAAQGGRCYHCHEPLSGQPASDVLGADIQWRLFPKNFLRHPVHLHHSHQTGKTLGAIHARCNAYRWQYLGE